MIVILSVVGDMRGFLADQGTLAQRAATVVSQRLGGTLSIGTYRRRTVPVKPRTTAR